MNNFIEKLKDIKVPAHVTQIGMNQNTVNKVLKSIPKINSQNKENAYPKLIPGIPIINNDELSDDVIEIKYSNGKTTSISIYNVNKIPQFKMEYECVWE